MRVTQSCPTLCDPMDCSTPGSSVHEISQARVLEWVAISFSRGSFPLRDRTQVSHIAGRFFTIWDTREAHINAKWDLNSPFVDSPRPMWALNILLKHLTKEKDIRIARYMLFWWPFSAPALWDYELFKEKKKKKSQISWPSGIFKEKKICVSNTEEFQT